MAVMFGSLVVAGDVSKEIHAMGILTGTKNVPDLVVTDDLLGFGIDELDAFVGDGQQNGGNFRNNVCRFLLMTKFACYNFQMKIK
jgi:hypothetical protein